MRGDAESDRSPRRQERRRGDSRGADSSTRRRSYDAHPSYARNAHDDDVSREAYDPREPVSAIPAMDSSAYSADRYRSRKRKMSLGKKIALGVVIALVVALACGGIAVAVWYNNVSNNIKAVDAPSNLVEPAADEPYYVLLMGSDAREGWEEITEENEGDRADSIMIARVDEKNKKVSVLSVPRDLRVKVSGHGYCKINSVVEYGGYDLLVKTLNDILNIRINYYAVIYFNDFLSLVDTLGGVTVEVPEGTAGYNMDETKPDIILPAGDAVHLNGEQALVLARCRHGWPIDQGVYAMGDYQRTLNQRNLIKAIAKEVLAQDVTDMPALIEKLSQSVETTMSIDRLVSLAMNMRGMDVESMQSAQLPIGSTSSDSDGWQAIMFQDVFEVMDANFVNGDPLFENLDNFNPENNGDDIGTQYTDGSLYAYTMYSEFYGSPYTDGFTPPKGSASSKKSSTGSSSSSSSSKPSS